VQHNVSSEVWFGESSAIGVCCAREGKADKPWSLYGLMMSLGGRNIAGFFRKKRSVMLANSSGTSAIAYAVGPRCEVV
jgi:hypothetical protein